MTIIADEAASRGEAIADRALAREALQRLKAEGVTVDGASIEAKIDRLRRKYADQGALGENQFPPILSQASLEDVGEDHLMPASAANEVDMHVGTESDSQCGPGDGRASRASARVVHRSAPRTKRPNNVIRVRVTLSTAEHVELQLRVGAAQDLAAALKEALAELDEIRTSRRGQGG